MSQLHPIATDAANPPLTRPSPPRCEERGKKSAAGTRDDGGGESSAMIDVAMTEVDGRTSFTVRYQLTAADARWAFWSAARDWLPVLIGIALLTLVCATW